MTVFISVNHGRSEMILCSYLSEWLRVEIIPVARKNGTETISLKESGDFMRNGPFKDMKSLNRYYRQYKKGRSSKTLKPEDVKIFVLMDVDGDRLSQKPFRTKEIFKGSFFYDNIVPVLSVPNLDEVLRQSGHMICDRSKPESYRNALDEIESVDDFC